MNLSLLVANDKLNGHPTHATEHSDAKETNFYFLVLYTNIVQHFRMLLFTRNLVCPD